MEIHHDKHHAAYVANLKKAISEFPDVGKMSVEDMFKDLNAIPEKIRTAVRNNGGGHFNHSLFWQMLKKDGGEPTGDLAKAIDSAFGNFPRSRRISAKPPVSSAAAGRGWRLMPTNN